MKSTHWLIIWLRRIYITELNKSFSLQDFLKIGSSGLRVESTSNNQLLSGRFCSVSPFLTPFLFSSFKIIYAKIPLLGRS